MILHTNGIEYDDRIRKEMLTVMKLYPDIKFKIFAIIDGDVPLISKSRPSGFSTMGGVPSALSSTV